MHCHEWTTPSALAKNEFFSDFLRPANLRWLSGMRINYASTASAYIGLSRGFDQAPIDGAQLRMLNLLAPHLATASRNFFAAADLRAVATQGLACLDAWPAALIILDRRIRPTFANQRASELLTDARVLRLRRGVVLLVDDIKRTNQLHDAVHRAISLGQPSHFLVSQDSRAETLAGTVLPLRADAVNGAVSTESKALFVVNGMGQTPRTGALRELFGLTPRETELAIALLNGGAPAAIAAHFGVSLATVRSQIRSLFTKTGTNRLPALIRALGTASPMFLEH